MTRLVNGIIGIFNQSPVRRGKPFWHYGKDFDTVKKEMSLGLRESDLYHCRFRRRTDRLH